jgi:hypothetical protein
VQLCPYTEFSSYGSQARDQYETISAQPECSNFSLEELRLADYRQRNETLLKAPIGNSPCTSALPLQIVSRSDSKKHPSHLNLYVFVVGLYTGQSAEFNRLRGPGIEIYVGTTTSLYDLAGDDTCSIWSLPKGLISYHSPLLEAACSRDFKERHENRITLPDEDPIVFALFVEWMYYGDYGIAPLSLPPADSLQITNLDAQCWVLGDKLLCTDFKNHAMRRLYAGYTVAIFNRVVTTNDMHYVCSNSGEHSKLRQIYVALVATHFSDSSRVHGNAEEWDSLVLKYADLRSLILQSFRQSTKCQDLLKSQEYYLDHNASSARVQPSP